MRRLQARRRRRTLCSLCSRRTGRKWHASAISAAPAAIFAPRVEALRAGLRELGYFEGRNFRFEFRWGEAPEMPELAAELVREGVDVIFAQSSTETAAALETTRTPKWSTRVPVMG